ncbi:precorrin-6y C5,15-methyltransferase (decarboxylating) subunit CbiE [Candidatus Oscillochloris fontis]|uniref:precorrin-6y C5,15-methyltransferase (decarboxylating) subunit CbiE n=1 Tax=Candidatus Oscillochloris fontis TaxID=2496868 RepID=UPI00101BCFDE|nr:precorrin-6y C5,15-methyltransferase (decarboxylating) subunit CbiE [Candidatus Oscillochloris fontis]
MHKIVVLGITGAGRASLPEAQIQRVLAADLLVGGERHLGYFPDFSGECLSMRQGLAVLEQRLRHAYETGLRAVVLASGDPLCYGIGASLRRSFSAEVLEIVPAPSAYQLAFAALGEPWHDAALLSAHGRPTRDVVRAVCLSSKAGILTDDQHTPGVIAQALLDAGMSPQRPCAVCENLGEPEQRIVRGSLGEIAGASFAPLNVLVIWNEEPEGQRLAGAVPMPCEEVPTHPGIPDKAISTSGGLLTQREIRLLSLAELAPQAGEIFWDLGAGSGAVSIEAARWQAAVTVYAVERRAMMCEHIRENLRRFPCSNVHLIEGTAPGVCADLPDPDMVFIGGSGGWLPELLDLVRQRLRPGGRLVLALVTLENLHTARTSLPDARLTQVQVSVAAPILGMVRLEAQNPVFLLTWRM